MQSLSTHLEQELEEGVCRIVAQRVADLKTGTVQEQGAGAGQLALLQGRVQCGASEIVGGVHVCAGLEQKLGVCDLTSDGGHVQSGVVRVVGPMETGLLELAHLMHRPSTIGQQSALQRGVAKGGVHLVESFANPKQAGRCKQETRVPESTRQRTTALAVTVRRPNSGEPRGRD